MTVIFNIVFIIWFYSKGKMHIYLIGVNAGIDVDRMGSVKVCTFTNSYGFLGDFFGERKK